MATKLSSFVLCLSLALLSSTAFSSVLSTGLDYWCSKTPYPAACKANFAHDPKHYSIPKKMSDFKKISIQSTIENALKTQSHNKWLGQKCRTEKEKAAWSDCLKLYEESISLLNRTVDPNTKCTEFDSQTWLSTALTNLEQNLTNDNKWMGFAACAIFAVKGHTGSGLSVIEPDPDFFSYSYQITLETDVMRLKLQVLDCDGLSRSLGSCSHLRLIFYTPSSKFSRWWFINSTVVRAIFETTNPFMVVQKCGVRLVYEQDAGWNSRIESIKGEVDSTCLNEVEDTSVRESAWLSQSWKWEKFIPPLEEESALVLRKNIESILPKYLEALNRYHAVYKFNLRGSPGWFHESFAPVKRSKFAVMSIKLPENLRRSKRWFGFGYMHQFLRKRGRAGRR